MRFVIDQNFPWHVLRFEWPPLIQIRPLLEVDPTLVQNHDDWEIFLKLDRRGDVDGFISNDAKTLRLPTEMVALSRTRLVLVVTDSVGDEAIRATGLVMVYLQEITRRPEQPPHIYVLRPARALEPIRPGTMIHKIAAQERVGDTELIDREVENMRRRGYGF